MPKTCIATCVKNEGRYLLEWIAWNKLIGFDEISIYDNGSTDNTRDLLGPLAANGIISLHGVADFPNTPPQIAAYSCELARPTCTEWIMFADPDEFLILRNNRTVDEFLRSVPSNVSQVCFNWRLFGSSGHTAYYDAPVIARFRMASKREHPVNRHVKALSRRSHVSFPTIHAAVMTSGLRVSDAGEGITLENNGLTAQASHTHAYLNHYIVKSREEFDAKIARGRGAVAVGDPNKTRKDPDIFWRGHNANDEPCDLAYSRLPELLAMLERISPPSMTQGSTSHQHSQGEP